MNEKISKTGDEAKLMIRADKFYGITINPEAQGYSEGSNSFIVAYSMFINNLKKYDDIFETYTLYPEYSPAKLHPRKDTLPRLHYHGICKINPIEYYTHGCMLLKKHNMIQIDDNPNIEYCTKNEEIMMQLCMKWKVPYGIRKDIFKDKKLMKRLKEWYQRISATAKPMTVKDSKRNIMDYYQCYYDTIQEVNSGYEEIRNMKTKEPNRIDPPEKYRQFALGY